MKSYYEKEQLLSSTYADPRGEVGVFQGVLLVQDALTEFFHQYQCDAFITSKSHQVVWAVARTKLFLEGTSHWLQPLRLKAFPIKISSAAIHMNFLLETIEGAPVFRARQEVCAIDVTNHSLRRIETTPFPQDLALLPPVVDQPHLRMKLNLEESCFAYDYTVRTVDTDLNKHMNNAAYVRLIVNAQPSAFWDAHRVAEFDIQHVNEAIEGETIRIYTRLEGDTLLAQIRCEERTLVKAAMKLLPRPAPQ